MQVTEADLRANYEKLETQQLLQLRSKGTLTEKASAVLEQVIAERGVTQAEQERVVSESIARNEARRAFDDSMASLGQRLTGQIVDNLVFFAVAVIGALLNDQDPLLLPVCISLAVLYLIFADGLPHGRSLGKRLVGTAVVTASTRQPCSYGQSAIRNLTLILLGPIDWLWILLRGHQRLGDKIAGTLVIRVRS